MKKLRSTLFRVHCMIVCMVLLAGHDLTLAQGTSHLSSSFINIGFGARSIGMGKAFTASAGGAEAVVWNPAGLSAMDGTQMTFYHIKQFNLIPYYFTAFATRMMRHTWMGLAFITSGDDVLRENQCYFAFGRDLANIVPGLRVGFSLKWNSCVFGNNTTESSGNVRGSGWGYGIDMGILYTPTKTLTSAFVLRDVVNATYWNASSMGRYTQKLPRGLIMAILWAMPGNLTCEVDLEKSLYADVGDKVHLGIENKTLKFLKLRGGATQIFGEGFSQDYTFGAGFRIDRLKRFTMVFDFAYQFHGLANTFHSSFSVEF